VGSTLSIVAAIRSMLPPADAAAQARIPEVVAAAADAGVPVLAGTDAGMGPHGMIRHEIGLLTEYGLSPEAALGAASWAARALLPARDRAGRSRRSGRLPDRPARGPVCPRVPATARARRQGDAELTEPGHGFRKSSTNSYGAADRVRCRAAR